MNSVPSGVFRGSICLLICLVFALAAFSQAASDKEETAQLLAETYFASGQHDKAIEAYQKILSKNKNDIEARMKLAQLLSWIKNYDDSIVEYNRILDIEPNNLQALRELAEVYKWAGNIEQAVSIYKKILNFYPNEKDVNILLAEVLIWQKNHEQAQIYLEQSVSEDNEKGNILYGKMFLYGGKYKLAEKVLLDIIAKNPDNQEARVLLADTYAYSKRFKKAISGYKELLKEIDDRNIRIKLADVLSWDKQYKEAITAYDEILSEKYDQRIHRQKARVLGWSREYEKAEQEYEVILEREYSEVAAIEKQAKAAYWSGRPLEGISAYKDLLAVEPDNGEAMFDLSQVYCYQSMWKESKETFGNILDILPNHFRASEGLEKVRLISEKPYFFSKYRFFEADSSGRDTDIKKYQIINTLGLYLNERVSSRIEYTFSEREFLDAPDIRENEYRLYLDYLNKPDWDLGVYFGSIDYNKNMDEQFYLFGSKVAYRINDKYVFKLNYDRERIENNSSTLWRYFHRHKFVNRLNISHSRKLKLGLDYLTAYYSDDNVLHQPGFDALYYLSFEPKRFYVKYRGYYKYFRDKTLDYWSPKGFWNHNLGFAWRHYLNKEEIFFGADDLYYEIGYDLSSDSEDNIGNKIHLELNWDVNKRLNLNIKGAFSKASSDVYTESEATAGLKYYF